MECPVCFVPTKQPSTLPCNHSFCHSCCKKWLRKKSECPLCRSSVKRYTCLDDEFVFFLPPLSGVRFAQVDGRIVVRMTGESESGIRAGDVIVSMNGVYPDTEKEAERFLKRCAPGFCEVRMVPRRVVRVCECDLVRERMQVIASGEEIPHHRILSFNTKIGREKAISLMPRCRACCLPTRGALLRKEVEILVEEREVADPTSFSSVS